MAMTNDMLHTHAEPLYSVASLMARCAELERENETLKTMNAKLQRRELEQSMKGENTMTENEKDQYIQQLESEIGALHSAVDGYKAERDMLIKRNRELEAALAFTKEDK